MGSRGRLEEEKYGPKILAHARGDLATGDLGRSVRLARRLRGGKPR